MRDRKITNQLLQIFCLACLLLTVINAFAADKTSPGSEAFNAALTLYKQEKYPEAAEEYTKSLEAAERSGDKHLAARCLGYISNIYASYGDYPRCLHYLTRGYNYAVQSGDKALQGRFTINLVNANCHAGNMPEAKKYYRLQSSFDPKAMDSNWTYYTLYNKARIAKAENRLDDALRYNEEAVKESKAKHLDKIYELYQYSEMGNIYLQQGHYEKSRDMGKLCLKMSMELKDRELIANAAAMLAESYKYLGNADSMKIFRKLYDNTADTVYNIPNLTKATTQLFEYENKQNSNTISNLTSTVSRQWWVIVIIAILLLMSVLLLTLLLRYNHKLRTTQKLLISRSKELAREEANTQRLRESVVQQNQQEILLTRITKLLSDTKFISDPELTLGKLAECIGSNTTYVSSVINSTYGKNFKTLLNERRISEAARRLTDQNYANQTIQAIYESVGYRNSVSFIRAFKKIYGMTPSEYQKLEGKSGD